MVHQGHVPQNDLVAQCWVTGLLVLFPKVVAIAHDSIFIRTLNLIHSLPPPTSYGHTNSSAAGQQERPMEPAHSGTNPSIQQVLLIVRKDRVKGT